MSRLPVLSAKDVIRILGKFGFQIYRQTGSHIHLWNEEKKLLVTVPNHQDQEYLLNIHTETPTAILKAYIP